MSTATKRKRTGIFGAFGARNPVGKACGFLIAVALCYGCWKWSAHRCGPVGWAEKWVYVETAWDAVVNPVWHSLRMGGEKGTYKVIVERTESEPLLTNAAYAAGQPWHRKMVSANPARLHADLKLYVYEDYFLRLIWPLWLLPLPVLVAGLAGGQIVDMLRLRKARQTGVRLRGNQLVEVGDWNHGMRE